MKISTWNLMRPNARTIKRNQFFLATLEDLDSDIIVLTETNAVIRLSDKYHSVASLPVQPKFEGIAYEEGENRVTIFSKFPFGKSFNYNNRIKLIRTTVNIAFTKLGLENNVT